MSGQTAIADVMGTVVSVIAPEDLDPGVFRPAVEAAFDDLRHMDEVFSTYKPDSPISRIRDGRLPLADLDDVPDGADIRTILAICATLKARSDGAFDAWRVGDPPAFDPSGAVKGWAAERAGGVLAANGVTTFVLGAGGDVVARGGSDEEPWRIGIADPHHRDRVLAVAELRDGAVATSGTAERGAHIYDPATGRAASGLAQVTIVGSSLTWADGYATAAMAMGTGAYRWLADLARRAGYQALVVDDSTGVWWTEGMPEHVPALSEAGADP